jgi:hypothetical protein
MTLESSERFWEMWPFGDYSIMSLFPTCNCAITLLHILQDQRSREPFSRACSLFLRHVDDIWFTLYLLHSLDSISERSGLPIPPSVILSHHGLNLPAGKLMDVPISFILPIYRGLCYHELDLQGAGAELRKSLSDWSAHVLEG